MKKVETAKELHGPVMLHDNIKHSFNEIEKHAENIKLMAGPIYLSDTAKHSFSEISKQVQSINQYILGLNHTFLDIRYIFVFFFFFELNLLWVTDFLLIIRACPHAQGALILRNLVPDAICCDHFVGLIKSA